MVKATAGYGPAAFALSTALSADPRFAWAEPNFYQDWQKYFTPNDTLYTSEWHLNNTAQQAGQTAGVDVDGALKGMVEKGWLKPNAAGTWYFLSADGAEHVK